jgi:hypothetical protein
MEKDDICAFNKGGLEAILEVSTSNYLQIV